ncbi:MAG: zinc-binding dehydrogenase [Christensenella sp.]|uniref:zinc-binding dehydrogenase n=1 Tax=Christensenella sp. TaxID=1935934 RepID=UPI002B1F68F8|nr:zinc-binding dehydrogenase [Christensenella sp.]MEA5002036.1 zinc-binding dehydrogenase [Christensenella sp.]
MKAVVIDRPGGVDVLQIKEVPIPEVKPGWVLMKIRAFGLGRSEVLTRLGQSPSVKLPRVIGIECVGEILHPSDSSFAKGQKVVTLMGGLGREFDGSYEEYALIPSKNIYPVNDAAGSYDWPTLAAIPETYYTAYSSVVNALRVQKGETLLIRGGTSTVSIAALQVAKALGATVISTTRNPEAKGAMLREHGADKIIKEQDDVSNDLFRLCPNGVDKVLEMVGTTTLNNSLALLCEGGIACMTGEMGGEWEFDKWAPMEQIKSETYLTIFANTDVIAQRIQEMFRFVHDHDLNVAPAHIFPLSQIRQAHTLVESGEAKGKVVVVNEDN